jgi:transposase
MDTMTTTPVTTDKRRTRRNHTAAVKAQIVAECAEPGASVAKVAMSHGINANIVHMWRRQAREQAARIAAPTPAFLPLTVEGAQAPCARDEDRHVRIELTRGALTMSVAWPLDAVAALSAWTREVLR